MKWLNNVICKVVGHKWLYKETPLHPESELNYIYYVFDGCSRCLISRYKWSQNHVVLNYRRHLPLHEKEN